MFSRSLKNGVTRADQASEVPEQGFEIVLDRLEQLGDSDHETSRQRDPSGHVLGSAGAEDLPPVALPTRAWHGWQNLQDPQSHRTDSPGDSIDPAHGPAVGPKPSNWRATPMAG